MHLSSETRRVIIGIANAIHTGELDPVVGSRRIVTLIQDLDDVSRRSELFSAFIAFESETEDIPRGSERSAWSKEALAEKDAKVSDYIERFAPTMQKACLDLIAELSTEQ